MTLKLLRGFIAASVATAAVAGSVISASAYELERHSQAEIREMYERMYFDTHSYSQYIEDYSSEYPSKPGKLGADTLEEGLNSINFCRYLAGLPYDIGLTQDYNNLAQHASLVGYMNNRLSHQPTKPADMSDELFEIGKKGAGESNIGIGYMNIQAAVVQGYMSDTDSGNLGVLGHRRWILNPDMQNTGLGMVYSSTAMYVRDKTREEKFTGDYICWPPSNMPYELVGSGDRGYAFSVTLNNTVYEQPSRDKVVVTLTSKLLGKTWTFDKDSIGTKRNSDGSVPEADIVGFFDVNTQNCGINNCIIFNPGPLPENDVIDVKVTGIYKNGVESPISYKVNFFNILDENDYSLGFDSKTYDMEVGGSLLIHGYDNPLKNGDLLIWYLCENEDDKVTDYVDMIQAGGTIYLTAKKEGKIEIFLGTRTEFFSDKYATITITHRHNRSGWIIDKVPTADEPGSRYKQCSKCGETVDREVMPATSIKAADIQLSDTRITYSKMGTPLPTVKIYSSQKRLIEGTDYSVKYKDSDKIGTASIIIEGIGYYSDIATITYEIVQRDSVDLDSLDISFTDEGIIYSGKAKEPKVTIREGNYTLEKGVDYSIVYENNVNAGTGKVTISGKGDYVGTKSFSFTIEPADIGYPWASDKLADVKHSGKPIMLRLDLISQVTGEALDEGVDYKVAYDDNVNIGTATVTVIGIGNYSGSTTNTFNIVSPADYTGPEVRDDVIEVDYTAAIVLAGGVSASNSEIRIYGADGKMYDVKVSSGNIFYADIPEGEYEVWVASKSCKPASAKFTVGSERMSVDVGIYHYGDINRDGKINVADISLSAAFTKALVAPEDDDQRDLADVNRDGVLNLADTLAVTAHGKGIQMLEVDEDFEFPTASENEKTTEELAAEAYEKIRDDNLTEFGVDPDALEVHAVDIDSDGVSELYISGSDETDVPERLYAFIDGEAVLIKEADISAGGNIILTDTDGELYVKWSEGDVIYIEMYEYAAGELKLGEKLAYPTTEAEELDVGDCVLIDEQRFEEIIGKQKVFS